ncbi:MAG: 2-aminoethylphosphonate--pyruvate transaminase [Candidatus Riflebacteria bacterium]|nr:2-aminoethylphosphonate--pyruvate transaminase [Candidatus Riflebacteria bacterium]
MIKRNILLNPGPATTTDSVKMAQVVPDICHREKEFVNIVDSIISDLTKIAGGDENYTTVLIGGSGTSAQDAVINSVVDKDHKLLVVNNGAYGERMCKIAQAYSIPYVEITCDWDKPPVLDQIESALKNDRSIKFVAAVHHETTTGLLNPAKEIGTIAKKYHCVFILDTISSFAGIPFNIKEYNIDFMMASSNKCIQGMPGCAFVICKKEELEKTATNPPRSFYLNLFNEYNTFLKTHEMRFTPPIQVIYSLRKAIDEFFAEGGVEARYRRYSRSWETLVKGVEMLGFKRLLKDEWESHILTTFIEPDHPNYDFKKLHDLLFEREFTIYPGKIGKMKTLRLANLGAIDFRDIENFLKELKDVMFQMNLSLK